MEKINRLIDMEKINRLRQIKHILREYTKGIIPINQIAESCLNTNMPMVTIYELGEKIYADMHTKANTTRTTVRKWIRTNEHMEQIQKKIGEKKWAKNNLGHWY